MVIAVLRLVARQDRYIVDPSRIAQCAPRDFRRRILSDLFRVGAAIACPEPLHPNIHDPHPKSTCFFDVRSDTYILRPARACVLIHA
jgi:hypothetical protein